MNYFELYNLPISFKVNSAEVKSKYFELSKKYHPDFFTQSTSHEKNDALEFSTENTNAFKTLSSFDKRMKYVLQLKDKLVDDEKYQLPNLFLMDMMELNESIIELDLEPNSENKNKIITQINQLEIEFQESINDELFADDISSFEPSQFEKIKEFYFKKKYLQRLKVQIQ
jgi:molecular chaperone HscB